MCIRDSFKGLRVKDLLSLAAGKNTSVNEACSYLSEVGLCARDYLDRELNDSPVSYTHLSNYGASGV